MERLQFNIEPEDAKKARAMHFLAGEVQLRTNDRVEAEMLDYLLPHMQEGGSLRPVMETSAALNRLTGQFSPAALKLRSMEFAFDRQMRRLFPEMYPHMSTSRAFWLEADPLNHPDFDHSQFEMDIEEKLLSTIAWGYAIYHLMSQVYKHLWPNGATALDLGCGAGLGDQKLALVNRYPFDSIQVLTTPRHGQPITPELPPDEAMQETVNYLNNLGGVVARAVGVDASPVVGDRAEADRESIAQESLRTDLVFSHTFPMSESERDPDGVREFFELLAEPLSPEGPVYIPPRNVLIQSPESLAQVADYLPAGKADMMILSAVTFQMSPEERAILRQNLLPYCHENTKVFITEPATVDMKLPLGLKYSSSAWWNRYGAWATFEIDPFDPSKPPDEICRHMTRRHKQMYLTPYGKALFEQAAKVT